MMTTRTQTISVGSRSPTKLKSRTKQNALQGSRAAQFIEGGEMFEETVSSIEAEELLDRQNLLKNIHPLMKLWYSSADIAPIKDKYGPFPSFWQDLEQWNHLKLIKKLYLTATEKRESGLTVDIKELEEKFSADSLPPYGTVIDESQQREADQMKTCSDGDKVVKKRRNRWGAAPASDATNSVNVTGDETSILVTPSGNGEADVDAEARKLRRSRWSTADVAVVPTLAPIAALSQEVVQQTMVMKVQLEQIGQRLVTVAQDAARISLDPSRSPSPPPRYDGNGKRSNTRDVRMKEELMEQRGKIIEELMKINPQFQPPSDFVRTKPFKRLMIPFREFPTYNFIGLIIGPRGNTQKELEQATGCKISIRGKGSSKEGSKGRAGKNPDDDEELHVHVTADDAAKVEEAAKLIAAFLNPIDDEKNDHKQKQLRELALINGTLKEEEYCPVCGEKGHRQFECPHRAKTFKAAGVKCSICGDLSHPTRDCPLKKDEPTSAIVLDSEYDSFMAELGDGGGGAGRAVSSVSSSAKPDSTVKPATDGDQGFGPSHTNGHVPVGTTMLGTVDLSGIVSTPASSSSYNLSRPFPQSSSIPGSLPMPVSAPRRQQTIIVVTAVLTGYVAPSTAYMVPGTSVAPTMSYLTATSAVPVPTAVSLNPPWTAAPIPVQPQHPTYSYGPYNNNPNPSYFPPLASSNYYQQTVNPWSSGGNPMSYSSTVPPPPPPSESIPLPPPPAAAPLPTTSTSSLSPWMSSAEQQNQGQQGISYNYRNDR